MRPPDNTPKHGHNDNVPGRFEPHESSPVSRRVQPDVPARMTPANTMPRVGRGRIGLWPLVMVMFFSVSGGAYGLEEAVGRSGAGMTLLLLLVVPVVWALPAAWCVGELQSAMPVEGGYYAWVKRGLGPFWGFQEGWWSWTNSFVDMAIYPVLFADYLDTFLTRNFDVSVVGENALVHWAVTLAVIWPLTLLNMRGARPVGRMALLFGAIVLLPFAAMAAVGIAKMIGSPQPLWQPVTPPDGSALKALGVGLFVVLWNYLGWDGPSTISGEIERAGHTYNRAMALAVPLVTVAYILPVAAGLYAVRDLSRWTDGAFPEIARALGGRWLSEWLAVGGLVSAAGLFAALLLSNSRVPFVLAEDGYLPGALRRLHPRFATPAVAIVLSSAVYSVFTLGTFADLVVIDVIVYSAALLLEVAALIALRRSAPTMRRPVRVPFGRAGLAFIVLAPLLVLVLAVAGTVAEEGLVSLILPAATLLSGPLLYPVLRSLLKRDRPDVAVPVEWEDGAAAARA